MRAKMRSRTPSRDLAAFYAAWPDAVRGINHAALSAGAVREPIHKQTGIKNIIESHLRSRPRMNPEQIRLGEEARREKNWKRWGPYLSERQWGTVREDYSATGECWSYFPHDHARSRAYRWGEDGLLGICDREGRLCFALAMWNGQDPILKERLFGLTSDEGNHGEDVKECYFYLDSTPTHSYMKALYKYPQRAFPVPAAAGGEPAARQARARIRADRHGHFHEQPLLRCDDRVRQGVAGRHSDPDSHRQSRPGRPGRCTFCRRSGFAIHGHGAAPAKAIGRSRVSCRPTQRHLSCEHQTPRKVHARSHDEAGASFFSPAMKPISSVCMRRRIQALT